MFASNKYSTSPLFLSSTYVLFYSYLHHQQVQRPDPTEPHTSTASTITLVFRAGAGPLSEVQVGPADVLATFAAAYTASGWLGGLDGVRNLLSKCGPFFSAASKEKQQQLFRELFSQGLFLQDSVVHILTSQHGPVRCEIPTRESAFGGDPYSQIIGLTICALAHECGYDDALTLFMEYLAPRLFDGASELLGVL